MFSELWKRSAEQTTLWSHVFERTYLVQWKYIHLRTATAHLTHERKWVKATPLRGKKGLYSLVGHQKIKTDMDLYGRSFNDSVWSHEMQLGELQYQDALKKIADLEALWKQDPRFSQSSWRPFWGKLAAEVLALQAYTYPYTPIYEPVVSSKPSLNKQFG